MCEILIVEAQKTAASALAERLRTDGMQPVIASGGTEALCMLDQPRFDAILLNRTLPDSDGLSVLRELRTRTIDTPVMVLSTRGSVADRIAALDGGADDFLMVPYHMDECMARVRRMVRTYRRRPAAENAIRCIADLTVDTERHVATRSGQRLPLTDKECAILELFAKNPGVTLTPDDIEAQLSPELVRRSTALIPVYIHYLRQKLDVGFSRRLLHTVRRAGYVLCADMPRK